MRTTGVVEGEVAPDAGGRDGHRLVAVQVDLLVLERAPEPLDEDVVAPAAFPIHADRDAVVLEQPGEVGARKLCALIRVEDRRPAIAGDGLLDRREAEGAVERDRDALGQDAATRPVHHGREIDEAVRHRDIRDIHRPHVVRRGDRALAKQVRINGVRAVPAARAGLREDGGERHLGLEDRGVVAAGTFRHQELLGRG